MSATTSRLKKKLCPGCQSPLKQSMLEGGYTCSSETCNFSITDDAYDRLTSGLYVRKNKHRGHAPSEEENLAALNNLGHEIPSADYSDRQPDV